MAEKRSNLTRRMTMIDSKGFDIAFASLRLWIAAQSTESILC